MFSDLDARTAARNFLQVPILAGSNQNEGDIFLVEQQLGILRFTMPVLTEIMSDILGQASQNLWMSREQLETHNLSILPDPIHLPDQ